jgi:general secretion pathway protein G
MLIVIAIIILLAGLLTGAAMRAFGSARRVQARVEIDQLSVALETFKNRYGVYPPSRIKLSETGNYNANNQFDADSLFYLQKIAPRLSFNATQVNGVSGIDWNGDGIIENAQQGGDYVLEGEQCLVFFLGGIPNNLPNSGPPSCTGFSVNSADPSFHVNFGGDIRPPIYEFNSNRLVANDSNGNPINASAKTFYCYLDTWSTGNGNGQISTGMPYAYFSSYKARNGYNRYFALAQNSDCSLLGVWPYYEFAGSANSTPRYLNPNTFQIISAGQDNQFGPGGTPSAQTGFQPAQANPWTPANPNPLGPGFDDQSNFSSSPLGYGQ